ncbi:Mediator of RNA polymerase II transcription subunit 18 [Dissostichus eleginoides]|uniref:Mediator of RNA polymerase II transcription subunit 18 n=1 Tax=Dissostichus eleginoides TaxID=100907 RepID=A0AAD9BBJ6_DISEL|nr:Mediator of RNA polymerase II transcription subunit 18 [Dissostichus eleginoides]
MGRREEREKRGEGEERSGRREEWEKRGEGEEKSGRREEREKRGEEASERESQRVKKQTKCERKDGNAAFSLGSLQQNHRRRDGQLA